MSSQARRRILVDKSRHKSSLKYVSNRERLSLEGADLATASLDERILLTDEALRRLEMEDPESARIVTLKFFGGFTNKEIAQNLGVAERTVERQWAYARACLFQMIQDSW